MSIKEVYNAVLEFEDEEIEAIINKTLDTGENPVAVLNEGLIKAMDEVGKLFSEGKLFVPEMLLAAESMKIGLEIIRPLLKDEEAISGDTVIIGTVEGDLHDIGKNLVAMMLESSGFIVHDLGIDVSADKFIDSAREYNAKIICLSALLTTTMASMRKTVEAIEKSGLNVITMVGGAPVTEKFSKEIRANGYAADAAAAVRVARTFC